MPISQFACSQVPRPMKPQPRMMRAASFSAAEQSRSVLVSSGPLRLSHSDDSRPSLLPTPRSQASSPGIPGLPSTSSGIPSRTTQPSPSLLTPINPSPLVVQTTPVSSYPRNVLRRKAPTIGQRERGAFQKEISQPDNLREVIPTIGNSQIPGHAQHLRFDLPLSVQQSSSSHVLYRKTMREGVGLSATHGPRELASLRTTTINTQSLPPLPPPAPTPFFASTSSPSTRYSESPGIWSRTSTPTSLSSYSPGIVSSAKFASSPSCTRLPVSSPSLNSSPQSARAEPKSPNSRSATKLAGPNAPSTKDERGKTLNPTGHSEAPVIPRNPPLRNLSMKFATGKQDDLDMKTCREQEEVAERQLFDPLSKELTRTESTAAEHVHSPSRPSREGTHQLELQPSPVIQSNLGSFKTTGHKRRESSEKLDIPSRQAPRHAHTTAEPANSVHSDTSQTATPSLFQRRPTMTLEKPEETKDTKKTTARRLRLFTRKSKPEANSDQRLPTRKGPAAGTGYEGYGKYAHPGRRPSVSSSSSRSVSSNKGNIKGRPDLDLDEFLLRRLEPVVINGRGSDGADLARTRSEQSTSNLCLSSVVSLGNPSRVVPPAGHSTESLASSAETSAEYGRYGLPSTSHRPKTRGDSLEENATIATSPVQTHGKPASLNSQDPRTKLETAIPRPSFDSYNSSIASLPRSNYTAGPRSSLEKERVLGKRKGFKWNFFQRSHGAASRNAIPTLPSQFTSELCATISPVAIQRPVAHYALVDTDLDSLDEVFRRVKESPATKDETSAPGQVPVGLNFMDDYGRPESLPPLPKLEDKSPDNGESLSQILFHEALQYPSRISKRPEVNKPQSRLASVGRIPRVVSKRDREHKPPLRSFSRPFGIPEPTPSTALAASQACDYNPPSRSTNVTRTDTQSSKPIMIDPQSTQSPSETPSQRSLMDFISGSYADNEFLALSPRKDSILSSSSGSEGTNSSFAAVTAVIPEPGSAPTEDEIWGEYDDLIEQFALHHSRSRGQKKPGMEERFVMANTASEVLQDRLNSDPDAYASPILMRPQSAEHKPESIRSSCSSVRLSYSMIASALRPSTDLSIRKSCDDPKVDRDDNTADSSEATQFNDTSASITPDQQQSSSSFSPCQDFETSRRRNTIIVDLAEREREGATAQTNIRSGSLMTSRWLSFGRVLFSPAHSHVTSRERERILVIDGLGNDDWSFYCALTYPTAEIFSLNVDPSPTGFTQPPSLQPLTNHYTIRHSSLESLFPFPKGYFAAAILRFPSSCSEKAQSNVISECKRVLRSGGYLEMSLLDLDMISMGIRTRRAVRKLKEKTCMTDASISLKPVSDSIQRLLGKHGFDNLRRCMVRVPVVGRVRSSESSSSDRSSVSNATASAGTASASAITKLSNGSSLRPETRKGARANLSSPFASSEVSLGDLLSDPSPSPANDEWIANIVARVGRWWYTRCYEIPILPNGDLDHSIWVDKKLLRECQQQGTGFRLLIAYAQKPSEVPRRTASV